MSEDLRFIKAMETLDQVRNDRGVDINGKKYSTVKDRIELFRKTFGAEYGINTSIIPCGMLENSGALVVQAQIMRGGDVVASGHAMSYYHTDEVTRTSLVEVTETNAIGRALACFGFHGGEYASANEMEAIPAKRVGADRADEVRKVRQGSKEPPRSEDERRFREDVDKQFPPSVNQYDFYVPDENDQNAVHAVFAQIDKIDYLEDLTAYYHQLAHLLEWVAPEDKDEIIASFSSRKKQLKG